MKNKGYSDNLKVANIKNNLNYSDISEEDIFALYYYSSEVGIFNMRHSKFKERHNVQERLVIIALDDITDNFLIRF